MAQLDRILPRLESGAASQIILEADAPISCVTPAGPQALTAHALTREQVLALVAEVAGPDDKVAVNAGAGIRFLYEWNGNRWLVDQDAEAPITRLLVRKWVDKEPAGTTATAAPNVAGNGVGKGAGIAATRTGSQPVLGRRADDRPFGSFESAASASAAMDRLLREQVSRKAADLHMRVGEPPILRMGGDMIRIDGEPVLDEQTVFGMVMAIMPDKNKLEFQTVWDTDFAHEIAGLSRFRVNVLRDRGGIAAVIRTIANTTVTVEEMGISPEVQQLCQLTKGLVLVTGPTGSGKSTTLCALVDLVNRSRSDHIITIEDPIEFVHQSKKCLITQRQVGTHTQSFKSALRAALREDPDIILVGELRDLETIAIAMETAETGHLVFGTLHTSTAASTINRIVDQFPADRQDQIRVMLSESLRAVISQTLCKKIGGGRVAAREILLVNKAVSSLIREGKTVQINNVIQTQKKLGMETLNDALLKLVKSKTIEPNEAYVKCAEKKDMAMKLTAAGYDMSSMSNEE
ncbi:MAG: type IV pilus twitching motility protein PilT [Gemmatimonadota bacterium]